MNKSITEIVRPNNLDDIVGMEHNKKIIRYAIEGSLNLNEPMPSFIVGGPCGTGKSTIAGIIGSMSKRKNGEPAEVHKYIASDITDPEQLVDISMQSEDGDVVYIEEAHALKTKVQVNLLEWIENHKLLCAGFLGETKKVSFVLPTTNPGKLSAALRNRCKILNVSYYSVSELSEILLKAAAKCQMNLSIDQAALKLLAQSSRGSPRTAIIDRLDMLRKIMSVDNREYNIDTVKYCLDINKVNEWGLEANDMLYCHLLYDKILENSGKPVSKKTMEQASGFSSDMMEEMIESYLIQIGVIRITQRGRLFTDFGYSVLEKEPIPEGSSMNDFDLDKLNNFLKDPAVRKMGMRAIASEFSLKYPQDNGIIREALASLGYKAVQKAGIVKI